MLIPLISYVLDRLPFGNSLKGITPAMLKDFMIRTRAPHWHEYAIRKRQWRRHACTACRWLYGVLPRDAAVFEPGCGSAANLLWLGQHGLRKLSGSDISPEALELGVQLAGSLHLPLEAWHDDALHPSRLPQQLDQHRIVHLLPGQPLPGNRFPVDIAPYFHGIASRVSMPNL